jgi:hypothetical protein
LKYATQLLTTCCIVCPCLQAVNRKTNKDEEAMGNFTVGLRFLERECMELLHINVGDTVMIYRIFSNLIRTRILSAIVFAKFFNEKCYFAVLIRIDREDKDDSDWVTDNDSVMSDDGESDE